MANSITVNTTALVNKAATIKQTAINMDSILKELKSKIKVIEGNNEIWYGPSSIRFCESFKTFSSNFEAIYNSINNCSTYLDKVADTYSELEEKIKQQISGGK